MSALATGRAAPVTETATCPACGNADCELFYSVAAVPTNSVLQVDTREAALSFPTGDIGLNFCSACGFAFNRFWEEGRTVYSEGYEETQGFSPTFTSFDRSLAEGLIDKYNLRDKTIFEIGCGKGEFLSLLCDLGHNSGIGYDPSFVPARQPLAAADRIRFERVFVDGSTEIENVDLVCCKMTLEHIYSSGVFIRHIRQAVRRSPNAICFIQVPNFDYILDQCAYWDVYYEHASYYTGPSLRRLLEREGFQVLRCWTDYDDQYLMIEARPTDLASGRIVEPDRAASSRVLAFGAAARREQARWRERFADFKRRGLRTAIWGSGSKAVSFMTSTGLRDEVDFVIDINPFRQGRFMPGTGHLIVPPASLEGRQPDVVVVMNPIYIREIRERYLPPSCRAELISVRQ